MFWMMPLFGATTAANRSSHPSDGKIIPHKTIGFCPPDKGLHRRCQNSLSMPNFCPIFPLWMSARHLEGEQNKKVLKLGASP
jgi:hypothetical protein